jgi:hypothetical protein
MEEILVLWKNLNLISLEENGKQNQISIDVSRYKYQFNP